MKFTHICIYTIILTLISSPIFSQFPSLSKIRKEVRATNRVINETTRTVKSINALKQELDQTAAEFNTKGRVEKGNNQDAANRKTSFAKIRGGKFKDIAWTPMVYVDHEIFPSAIIGLSSYRGTFNNELEVVNRPIGFVINSTTTNQLVRWEIESSDKRFFDIISGEFIVDEANRAIHIMPEIPWNYEALSKNISNTPASVTYRFVDDQGNKVEKSVRVNYRSINDCILSYKNTSTHYLFAAYVQESHPEIDVILREALETGFIDNFSAYQSGKSSGVILQVLAIWRALQLRKFQYSSITTASSADSKDIFTQSVRTFENSIKTSQANCVDGTVMFASILRKIGINTEIVTVPGHCYLSIFLDAAETDRLFLETTQLGNFTNYGETLSAEGLKEYTDLFITILADRAAKHQKLAQNNQVFAQINVRDARKVISAIPVYAN